MRSWEGAMKHKSQVQTIRFTRDGPAPDRSGFPSNFQVLERVLRKIRKARSESGSVGWPTLPPAIPRPTVYPSISHYPDKIGINESMERELY